MMNDCLQERKTRHNNERLLAKYIYLGSNFEFHTFFKTEKTLPNSRWIGYETNYNEFAKILTNLMKNVTSLILIFALGTKFLQETYDLYKLKNWAHGSPAWYYLWINQDITNANRASLKTWALSFWHFPQFFSQKSKQLPMQLFSFLFFIVM